jgi:hypothetical protein
MNYDKLSTEEILEGVEFKPHDFISLYPYGSSRLEASRNQNI